ncbi:MAG: hypothetical protein WC744_01595 [Patescibacteria group bacterium]|jgi:hypothetical protein
MALEDTRMSEGLRTNGKTGKMTFEQAEILHHSFKLAKKAANHFSTDYDDLTSVIDQKLHKQVDQYVRRKENIVGDKPDITIEKALNEQSVDIGTVVSISKKNEFSHGNAIKLVEDSIACRLVEISAQKIKGASLDVDDSFFLETKQNKVNKIITEFEKYGIEAVDVFYKICQEISQINSPDVLLVYEAKLGKLSKTNKLNRLVLERASAQINGRRNALIKEVTGVIGEKQKNPDQEYEKFYQLLQEALEYLDFLYPGKNKSKFIVESYMALAKVRDMSIGWVPFLEKYFASCPALMRVFWQKQLNRDIEHPEQIGLNKKITERLKKHVFDKKLMSESAAWLQSIKTEKNNPEMNFYAKRPSAALVAAIKEYLAIPRDKRNGSAEGDKITIIINDNKVLKMFLKPGSTDVDIENAIRESENKVVEITDPKLKYRLKADSYRPNNHSKEYLEFYQHQEQFSAFGVDAPALINNMLNKPENGDYIFRLTTKAHPFSQDKNSPFLMNTVDSNKALIDIDFSGHKGAEISMKYSHHFFDADNQSDVFDQFAENFLKQANGFLRSSESELQKIKLPNFTSVNEAQELNIPGILSDEFDEFPIFESIRTGLIDRTEYKALELKIDGETHKIPANIIRDILTAQKEGVNVVYTLYKIDKPPTDTNPAHDEISPLTLGLSPFKNTLEKYREWTKNHNNAIEQFDFGPDLEKIVEWIVKTEKAIKRTREGQSYQAVVAAPTDRLARWTYEKTKKPHGPPSQLVETGGMSSGINVKGKIKKDFVTAVSYTSGPVIKLVSDDGKKIVVEKNIGVIGYSGKFGDVNVSIRKSLINAQYQIAELFADNVKAVKIIEPLIKAWEDFTVGDFSFEEYQNLLKSTYDQLKSNLGRRYLADKGITNHKKLQFQLNNRLKNSTKLDERTTIDRSDDQQLFRDFFDQLQSAVASRRPRFSPDTFPFHRRS